MTTLLTRTHLFQPEWVAVALASGGWLSLALAAASTPAMIIGVAEHHTAGQALLHAAVMAQAMMTPLVLPQVHRVAVFSLWPRRYRAAGLFLLGYLAVWTAVTAAMMLLGQVLADAIGRLGAIAVAFAIAVGAAYHPARKRLICRCAATRPLAVRGPAADLDCVTYGIGTARACVTAGWPMMFAATVHHGLIVMAAATFLTLVERRQRNLNVRRWGMLTAVLASVVIVVAVSQGIALAESSVAQSVTIGRDDVTIG